MRTLVTNGVHEYELEGFTIKHNEEGTAWIFFSPMDEIWKPAASLEEACKKINAELDCLLLRDVGIERDFEQIDSAHEVERNAVYRVLAEVREIQAHWKAGPRADAAIAHEEKQAKHFADLAITAVEEDRPKLGTIAAGHHYKAEIFKTIRNLIQEYSTTSRPIC
tara:strand:+ start:387 stop:881 length:495 start_codon:yes stop_codon:yes gene_type:complete